jgi:hypothetical protein
MSDDDNDGTPNTPLPLNPTLKRRRFTNQEKLSLVRSIFRKIQVNNVSVSHSRIGFGNNGYRGCRRYRCKRFHTPPISRRNFYVDARSNRGTTSTNREECMEKFRLFLVSRDGSQYQQSLKYRSSDLYQSLMYRIKYQFISYQCYLLRRLRCLGSIVMKFTFCW